MDCRPSGDSGGVGARRANPAKFRSAYVSDQRKTIKLDGEKRAKFKALGVDVVRGES